MPSVVYLSLEDYLGYVKRFVISYNCIFQDPPEVVVEGLLAKGSTFVYFPFQRQSENIFVWALIHESFPILKSANLSFIVRELPISSYPEIDSARELLTPVKRMYDFLSLST